MGQQGLEPGEVTVLGGREEPLRQLALLLTRRGEPGSAGLDLLTGTSRELADVVLALADDLR